MVGAVASCSARQRSQSRRHYEFRESACGYRSPIVTGYLIGSSNDYKRAFIGAAIAIVIGIAGYGFLLGRIERILDPDAIGVHR